jgi:uncharacterized protein (UPF0548 family)
MFFAQRPSTGDIERFLAASRDLPLSYREVGIVSERPPGRRLDEQRVVIGQGRDDFDRARAALLSWKQFDIGWVETFPRNARVEVGTVVSVLIRHLGFWSLNGARVVYLVGTNDNCRFGFAYGALTNHAECGEELFEVFIDPLNQHVSYRILAMSWPQTALTYIGQPIVRILQARFRRDSAAAMTRSLQSQVCQKCQGSA